MNLGQFFLGRAKKYLRTPDVAYMHKVAFSKVVARSRLYAVKTDQKINLIGQLLEHTGTVYSSNTIKLLGNFEDGKREREHVLFG